MYFRNPLMLMDWVYALSAEGREFKKLYTFIHEFSDKLINTRSKELVSTQFRGSVLYTLSMVEPK